MYISDKIINDLKELELFVKESREKRLTITVCQGHFNVIHPGHLRFLEFAKKYGDCLLVCIQGESKILNKVKNEFYPSKDRARGVASLEIVNKVFIYDDTSFEHILKIIKPDSYVLGEEFSKKINEIQPEINVVEQNNGKVIFSSGDVFYSPVELLDKNIRDIIEERKTQFIGALGKQKINIKNLLDYINSFKDLNILVIGDTIIDQYVACDPLGMSAEAPVLVVREIEGKEFIGGAAIVARHVQSLGAKCRFISVVGNDEPANFAGKQLKQDNINYKFIVDKDRPTVYKIRYMVGTQKILRVSRLKDHHVNQKIELEIINYLKEVANTLDGIIVSDFGYGIMSPRILEFLGELSQKYNIKLFGDSQSSSQIGNLTQFNNYYILTPTEKEARIALNDKYNGLEYLGNILLKKTNSKNIILKLDSRGFIAFESTKNEYFINTQYFPALNPYPVDVIGAGDSLLTGVAVSSCSGANLMEASTIGAVVASIAISKVGNVPIKKEEVIKSLMEF